MQVLSVIADFRGKNPAFQKHIVEIEKDIPNGGRSFEEILAVAMRTVQLCKNAGTH